MKFSTLFMLTLVGYSAAAALHENQKSDFSVVQPGWKIAKPMMIAAPNTTASTRDPTVISVLGVQELLKPSFVRQCPFYEAQDHTHLTTAASPDATFQYTSEQFVESCGAILFDLSDNNNNKVCLIHYNAKNEWMLAKGRRNCGECRQEAALREAREEQAIRPTFTQLQCILMPRN
ncbi:hypothetical protein AWENTII_000087 [Aspergillus wentii]